MLKHNKLPIVILTLLLLPIFSSTSYAQVNAVNTRAPMQNREGVKERVAENLQEKRDDIKGNLCERATTGINNKINRFNTNREDHITRYTRLITRLEEIAVSLNNKGYDTVDLEEKTAILNDMIEDYIASYDDFVIELDDSTDLACGESDGAFRDALSSIKDSWNDLQQMRQDIRSYYSTEIRGAIKDLREQARSNSISNEEVTNE